MSNLKKAAQAALDQLEQMKKMFSEDSDFMFALSELRAALATEEEKQQTETVYQGYINLDGVRADVEFVAPALSTVAEKDAAFMAALAQQADIDYLSVGGGGVT